MICFIKFLVIFVSLFILESLFENKVNIFCLPFSDLIQKVENCPLCRVYVVLCDCLICIKPVSIGLLTCNYVLANKTTTTWHVMLSLFSLDGPTWDNYICQAVYTFYLGDHYFFCRFDWMLDNLSYYSYLIQPIKF